MKGISESRVVQEEKEERWVDFGEGKGLPREIVEKGIFSYLVEVKDQGRLGMVSRVWRSVVMGYWGIREGHVILNRVVSEGSEFVLRDLLTKVHKLMEKGVFPSYGEECTRKLFGYMKEVLGDVRNVRRKEREEVVNWMNKVIYELKNMDVVEMTEEQRYFLIELGGLVLRECIMGGGVEVEDVLKLKRLIVRNGVTLEMIRVVVESIPRKGVSLDILHSGYGKIIGLYLRNWLNNMWMKQNVLKRGEADELERLVRDIQGFNIGLWQEVSKVLNVVYNVEYLMLLPMDLLCLLDEKIGDGRGESRRERLIKKVKRVAKKVLHRH